MLSKKMAFSLMSLITLLALAFAVPSAMAAEFEIKIAGPTAVDYAQSVATPPVTEFDEDVTVMLKVSSGQPIADLGTAIVAPATTATVKVYAFNKAGFSIDLTENDTGSVVVLDQLIAAYPMKTPKEHRLEVTITGDADDDIDTAIAKVIIEIQGGITSADPTLATADAKSKADAVRHTITLTEAVSTVGLPGVVSIQRLRPGSQTVVSAFQEERIVAVPFNVRIVLTEHPNGPDPLNAVNLVEVENGVPSNLVVGVKFARRGGTEMRIKLYCLIRLRGCTCIVTLPRMA